MVTFVFRSKEPKQSNHKGTLQSINTRRNHTHAEWSNCLLHIGLLPVISHYSPQQRFNMKTTFNTMPGCGRHHYHCLTIGAKSSQDVYQVKINQLLEGLNDVITIHDDITMFGKYDDAHEQNLTALMERAQKVRLDIQQQEVHNQTTPDVILQSSLW